MQPQPSTSAGASRDTPPGRGPMATDGVQDGLVASTSGSPPVQQQQQEEQLFLNFRASFKQINQLFASTLRVKLKRCDDDPITGTGTSSDSRVVRKVKEESDTGSSFSDDDEVKVLRTPLATKAKLSGPKKKQVKSGSNRKSTACCTICRKSFRSSYYLKTHMRMHTGDKRYKCENCGLAYLMSSGLNSHKKARAKRNGVCPKREWRPKGAWTCNICGKRMKEPTYYVLHMRRHRGEKPFECGDCGKRFVGRWFLKMHRRIHTGVWPHNCVFCDKGFHARSHLLRHLRAHTEEKPYFCKVEGCGASFSSSFSLEQHRRQHH